MILMILMILKENKENNVRVRILENSIDQNKNNIWLRMRKFDINAIKELFKKQQ